VGCFAIWILVRVRLELLLRLVAVVFVFLYTARSRASALFLKPPRCALPSSLSLPVPCTMKSHLPVRPLLVKHTMTAVPASDRLSALQRHVHVAVAALVVDGARGCVDLRGGRWVRGGLLGVVGCGHFGGLGVWVGGRGDQ
jgi:hypothetical protein